MIQPISQQVIFQDRFIPQNHLSCKGLSELQIVKGDKEGDIKKMRRNYNILLLMFASLTALATGLILRGKNNISLKTFKTAAANFESLKNNPNIPTVDTCKSLNKDLKACLERYINIDKAGSSVISEIGEKEVNNNRFLLFGPPGTGKSFFAKVFAKSTDAEYMEITFSDWNSR